jgi:pyrroloquinoline quinone biosynthesis protein D
MDEASRPSLAPGVRLHHDVAREKWVLLSPEKVIETGGPTNEILRLCDGERSLAQIVDALAAMFTADRAEIDTDVRALLTDLAARRLVLL